MSFDFNYKFWVGTKTDIQRLIKRQNVLKRMRPVANPIMTYKILSELYVLYVDLVNKLGYCYSHTFQVQKRNVVRGLTESATQRLIELKNELKNLELSEYTYIDKALIAKKLTPYDLVIWRSPNFLYRRPPEIQNMIYENKMFMDEEQKREDFTKTWIKMKDAVILIQSHERARRARVYKADINYDKNNLKIIYQKKVAYMFTHKIDQTMSIPVKRTIFNADFIKSEPICQGLLESENLRTNLSEEIDVEAWQQMRNKAALVIQTAWRAYKSKKIYKNTCIFKQTLFGMKNKKKLTKSNQYTDAVVEMYQNELLKKQLDEDFVKCMTDERTRLLQHRSPWIMEDISDHIRAWFKEFYDKVGDFHPYPEVLKSGTVLVLIDETMTPEELHENLNNKNLSKEEKKKKAEKLKLQKQKEKEKIKKEKLKEAKRRKKMKDAGIYDIADELKRNKNIENIEKIIKQYSIDWKLVDEYLNKNHEAIKEWITEGELATIHMELRALVDEYMRIEHELLRRALCADLKKTYKPAKVKKANKKKGKKKKVKDLTADRSLESLYDELWEAGIIEKYSNKSFEEFVADFNFVADDTRDEDDLTTLEPAKGDIKMVVQECMLGMGEFTVDKPKSLCLVGPLHNGKKLLCNIIASELDAVFMNLSPEKTCGFGENITYFLHVVLKVAKAFQPTILFIGDVHRIFWKKIPKDQEYLNPRLLQKYLMKKIIKPIKKEDKIMVLGTSDTPWSAKSKLKTAFQKILLVPKSDYGTSFLLWLELLAQNTGEDNVDDYMISALGRVLQSYNSGDVYNNIYETLNVRRRMKLKSIPLNPHEFVEHFLEVPQFPPEIKIMEKFDKWFNKANKLCVQRTKFKNDKQKDKKKK